MVVANTLTLIFSTIVSRHGIRAPYPPLNQKDCNTFDKYSNKTFPDFADWGMTEDTFCDQWLTPHGEKVIPRMGEYYADSYRNAPGFDFDCDRIAVYADNITRDHQTAERLLVGMGCEDTEIVTAGENHLRTKVWPVVHDHYNELDCALPTEEQISGLYGGDVNAITDAYRPGIEKINEVLGMTGDFDASICSEVNPNFDQSDGNCNLFKVGYEWTGTYWMGNFKAPLSYAGYWAEYFMFQYLSNLTDFAFGKLTGQEVSDLYAIHVQNMYYGSSIWDAKAYSSQQLGYILASLQSVIDGVRMKGVEQSLDKNVLLLVSHDFNNFYLQRLLGIDYFALGFPQNVATTAGSLRFDLHQNPSGRYFVSLTYTAATPDQQRENTNLLEETPAISRILIPGCGEIYCPFELFKDIVTRAIDSDCIEQPLRSSLTSFSSDNDSSSSSEDWANVYVIWAITTSVLLMLCVIARTCSACRQKCSSIKSPTEKEDDGLEITVTYLG